MEFVDFSLDNRITSKKSSFSHKCTQDSAQIYEFLNILTISIGNLLMKVFVAPSPSAFKMNT